MYKKMVEDFVRNPRDVHTVPFIHREYKWFYVFAENGNLYVEPAHNHNPKCSVKRRLLQEKECNDILSIYHRRARGEKISAEAQKCTRSQVYWYGIFSELNM